MVKVKCCVGCQRNCKCLRMTWINRKVRTGTGQPVLHSDSCPQWVKWSPLWGPSSSVLNSAPNVDSLGRLTGNSETHVFMVQSSLPGFMTGVGLNIQHEAQARRKNAYWKQLCCLLHLRIIGANKTHRGLTLPYCLRYLLPHYAPATLAHF